MFVMIIELILNTVFAVAVTKLALAVVKANVSVFPSIEVTFTIFGICHNFLISCYILIRKSIAIAIAFPVVATGVKR
jgi:hypothetical protein